MKTVKISLNSIDKVKSFVNDLTKFDTDFDLVSGRYVIDAKSIMGIFSLDLSNADRSEYPRWRKYRRDPYCTCSVYHRVIRIRFEKLPETKFRQFFISFSASFSAPHNIIFRAAAHFSPTGNPKPHFRCSGSPLSSPVLSSSARRSSHPAFSLNS